ncbi:MAG: hypothetical protein CVU39_04135 [Chloroflexi bacterium HGW-Chloroflexi-10]|nr:MAG: hypothetical protein CVU39_04135 [Chloroflexi bacterium HGW-Chloroflexi-10]
MKNSYFIEIRLDESESIRNGYDFIYSEENLSQLDSFYIWFYNKIGKPKMGKILDIACGHAEFLNICTENSKEVNCYGCDISQKALENAKNNHTKVTFITSTAEALPYKNNYFDIVTNIGSLEHFGSLDIAINEMKRVTKDNGKIYILVPNTFSLLTNIWNVVRFGQIAIDIQPLQRYGTYRDWENLITRNGLSISKSYKYERPFPKTGSDFLYFLQRPKEIIRLLLGLLIPKNLSWCFLFECQK